MQLKSEVCCDRRQQWGHASAPVEATKASRGTVTHRRLQGCRGSSRRATRCVCGPPTHIPPVHPQRDPGMSWAALRAGSQFYWKWHSICPPADLTGRRNGFCGVTEGPAGRASPWLIFTAPLNVSGARLWSHTTCLHARLCRVAAIVANDCL